MSSVNTHYQNQVADLLGQIRAHQGEPSSRADLIRSDTPGVGGIGQVNEPSKGNFATYMTDAINDVNDTQQTSAALKNAYERGEDVPLTEITCAPQAIRGKSIEVDIFAFVCGLPNVPSAFR